MLARPIDTHQPHGSSWAVERWIAAVVVACAVTTSSLGHAATWIVDPGDAWPVLEAGDVVALSPGTYQGPWTIEVEDVTVNGAGATLLGDGEGSTLQLFAARTTVRGLTIDGAGPAADLYAPDAGVWMIDCHGCTLDAIDVRRAPAGVRIEASHDVTLTAPTLRGGDGPGITAYQADGLHVLDADVRGYLDGIYVEHGDALHVEGGRVLDSKRYGLHVMFGRDTLVERLEVAGGAVGSAIMYGHGAVLDDVRFTDHAGPMAYGLLLQRQSNVQVRHALLSNNAVGTWLVASEDVTLDEVVWQGNGTAVLLQRERTASGLPEDGTGNSLLIHDSTFAGNAADVAVDDPQARVELLGNAFDRGSRLDMDGDGRVDVAHAPTTRFAVAMARAVDASTLAFQPGVLLASALEARLPELSGVDVHDPWPRTANAVHVPTTPGSNPTARSFDASPRSSLPLEGWSTVVLACLLALAAAFPSGTSVVSGRTGDTVTR